MAKLIYYPELKEERPNAELDASICYSKYVTIHAKIELKGRGINFYSNHNGIM